MKKNKTSKAKSKIGYSRPPAQTKKENQEKMEALQHRISELEIIILDNLKQEDLLYKMQERFRMLVSHTPAVLYICKTIPPYTATYVTDNVRPLLGYEPKEFIETPSFWADHIHPEDTTRVFNRLPQVFNRKRHTQEYRFRHKDGSYRWMHDEMQLVFDSYGNPTAFYGFLIDITERKQVEEEIRRLNVGLERRVLERTIQLESANEELKEQIAVNAQKTEKIRLLSNAIKSVDDLVSITDLEHNYIYVNEAFEKTYGFTNEELFGKNIELMREYFDPHQTGQRIHLETIKKGGWEGERINKRKDGSNFEIWLKTSVVRDENNQPIALVGVARDITERKLAEQKLYESEERYRRAISQANVVPFQFDYQTETYLYVGEGIKSLTGYSREEFTLSIWKSLIQEVILRGQLAGLTMDQAKQRIYSGELKEWETDVRIKTRTGETRWLAETFLTIVDNNGKPISEFGILQDINDRKLAEEALRTKDEQYRQVISLIDAVVYYRDYKTKTYRFMDEGIEVLTGYPAQEFTTTLLDGIRQETVFHGEIAGLSLAEGLRRIQAGEIKKWQVDHLIRTKGGEPRWISESAIRLLDEQGKIIGSLGILQDITDRK